MKKLIQIWIPISLSCLISISWADQAPVVLKTHLQPPYQIIEAGELKGQVPEVLACVFGYLELPYVLSVGPRKRNRRLLELDRIDGFLLSIPDAQIDKISQPSDPVVLERWRYFKPKSFEPSTTNVIGTLLGSNESLWLSEMKGGESSTANSLTSLIKMLKSNRVQQVLADESAFLLSLDELGLERADFNSQFVKYVPLVTYFAKRFTAKKPNFIKRFNESLRLCLSEERHATVHEKAKLERRARSIVNVNLDNLLPLITSARSDDSYLQADRNIEDEKWKSAVKSSELTLLINKVIANSLSKKLQDIARDNIEITEIFVMDQEGYILGMNQVTSDYWQGDEEAYITLSEKINETHFSLIEFDHSTRKFQIQVSFPIRSTSTGKVQNIVTIGFDPSLTFVVL